MSSQKKQKKRKKTRTRRQGNSDGEVLELHYCEQCQASVVSCEHDPNALTKAVAIAGQVERGAKAAGALAGGFADAINSAASILGGRFRG